MWEIDLFLFSISGEVNIVDLEIFSVDNSGLCPSYHPAHVSVGGEDLPHDETSSAGMLVIHAGELADRRRPGTIDIGEKFEIEKLAPGVYDVKGMGFAEAFHGVSSIFFDGGKGNDALVLVNADQFDIPVIAYGGKGTDTLDGGMAGDRLYGGDARDVIRGRGGDDTIEGGEGNDDLSGGSGSDTILGGLGDDRIDGNAGSDPQLDGGPGKDVIYGDTPKLDDKGGGWRDSARPPRYG